MQNLKMQFTLRGFSDATGFRVFSFEGIALDRTRLAFTVRTDIALTRQYGISLQELPLLCRGVLERDDRAEDARSFTYTEDDMRLYARDRAAAREEAARKKKPPRRPTGENLGSAWRAPTR